MSDIERFARASKFTSLKFDGLWSAVVLLVKYGLNVVVPKRQYAGANKHKNERLNQQFKENADTEKHIECFKMILPSILRLVVRKKKFVLRFSNFILHSSNSDFRYY